MTIEFVIQQIENVKLNLQESKLLLLILSEYISDENITVKNMRDAIDSLSYVTVNIRRSIKALQALKDVLK